jgi:3'(2'), 5'-bisphosphate nucleotidase
MHPEVLGQQHSLTMIPLLKTAIKAALDAGEVVLNIYCSEDFNIEKKSDSSPLTRADIASNELIERHLSHTGIPILSEEGSILNYEERKHFHRLWIVDPLDGTKEFIKRNGEFTVNIALIENGLPIMGVVYLPVFKELYFATIGGAFKCSSINTRPNIDELIRTSQKLPLEVKKRKFTIATSRSHMNKETEIFIEEIKKRRGEIDILQLGSSLKLCLIAEGIADYYPRFSPTMEWDTAAGHAICKYSGAEVMDQKTKSEMTYNRESLLNNSFIASRSTLT